MNEVFDPLKAPSEILPILYKELRKLDIDRIPKIPSFKSEFHQTKHRISVHFYKPISQMSDETNE